jgi:2-polyprenyl-3-methyl-5-hydroxy-6-metoxy-1,4-benzoquinol methylase
LGRLFLLYCCPAEIPVSIQKDPAGMWDERYSRDELVYGDSPNTFLRTYAVNLKPDAKVLVPGDGYGRNGLWLARQGFRVHTVDVSSVGVERARKNAAAAGVKMQIEQGDLTTWNWPESQFDAVASIFVHMLPVDRQIAHAGMLRTAKPGGVMILQAFSPAQLQYTSGGPKQLDLLYTAEMLRRDFASAEIVELKETVAHLNEGRLHSGKGAVVQGIFRKK